MYTLTPDELKELCIFLTKATQPYYPACTSYLLDLFNTGCRSSEPLIQSLWTQSLVDPAKYTLQPLKGNKTREIKKTDMSDDFNHSWFSKVRPYNSLSLRQLEFSMAIINPAGRMEVGKREVKTYIFRYNFVNELVRIGFGWNEIQQIMGWYNPTLPYSYTEREVRVANQPPY